MKLDIKQKGRLSSSDKPMVKLLNCPAILASGFSNEKFLPLDPDELCDRLKILLQEKQAGNDSHLINEEIVAIIDKLLEHKCITKKNYKNKL